MGTGNQVAFRFLARIRILAKFSGLRQFSTIQHVAVFLHQRQSLLFVTHQSAIIGDINFEQFHPLDAFSGVLGQQFL